MLRGEKQFASAWQSALDAGQQHCYCCCCCHCCSCWWQYCQNQKQWQWNCKRKGWKERRKVQQQSIGIGEKYHNLPPLLCLQQAQCAQKLLVAAVAAAAARVSFCVSRKQLLAVLSPDAALVQLVPLLLLLVLLPLLA